MTSTKRKTILVFTDWYLPGYKAGGPIRSLANLVNAVEHNFYIVTGCRDHHSVERYDGVKFDCWVKSNDRIHVQYLSDNRISAKNFEAILDEIKPDVVYLNSLFSPSFTLLPMRVLRAKKNPPECIVAPRGMLKPGALSVKGFKKKVFLRVAKVLGWYSRVKWHATNEDEIREIKSVFGFNSRIHLSPNLSNPLPVVGHPISKNPGELKLVCVARISPEKGILEAIRFLVNAQLTGTISCRFIGTQQNAEYLRECQIAASAAPNIEFEFSGEMAPDQIQQILRNYHFFYLTTWGENFGHSIAEALHCGLPVIISDKTPWQDLEKFKAGWVLPMEASVFKNALNRALNMDSSEYNQWSDSSKLFVKSVTDNPERLKMAQELFS